MKAIAALMRLRALYRAAYSHKMYKKVAYVDGKYYLQVYGPAVPSRLMEQVQADEINRAFPFDEHRSLRVVLLAITTKCPLNCEHCFEWHNLGRAEEMTKDDLLKIIADYQDYGTSQIVFGGGEPMIRFKDLIYLLQNSGTDSDFWMYTSGLLLDRDRARKLKSAGLRGVMVSLDNHIPAAHDAFRGKPGMYEQAIKAAQSAISEGLVTGLALCPKREYATRENIGAYMEVARSLGVAFVQILEPRNAGRYMDKDVQLNMEQTGMLDSLMDEYNSRSKYRSYPIIRSPNSVKRRIGCVAGDRGLYINSLGEIQKCPFCAKSYGNALERDPASVLNEMRSQACPAVRSEMLEAIQ